MRYNCSFLFILCKDSRLVIAHKDSRSVPERILAADTSLLLHATCDPKRHTGSEPHAPLEGSRYGPLNQTTVSHHAQGQRHECSIQGADAHKDKGANCECVEGEQLGGLRGQHERQKPHGYDEHGRHGEVEEPAHGEDWRRGSRGDGGLEKRVGAGRRFFVIAVTVMRRGLHCTPGRLAKTFCGVSGLRPSTTQKRAVDVNMPQAASRYNMARISRGRVPTGRPGCECHACTGRSQVTRFFGPYGHVYPAFCM